MKARPTQYSLFNFISAIGMMAALFWLTISLPFVYSHQKDIANQFVTSNAEMPVNTTDEETNPFGNNTEEKAPTGSSSQEEYMHDHDELFLLMLLGGKHKKSGADSYYIAFHGELLSPPPEA